MATSPLPSPPPTPPTVTQIYMLIVFNSVADKGVISAGVVLLWRKELEYINKQNCMYMSKVRFYKSNFTKDCPNHICVMGVTTDVKYAFKRNNDHIRSVQRYTKREIDKETTTNCASFPYYCNLKVEEEE